MMDAKKMERQSIVKTLDDAKRIFQIQMSNTAQGVELISSKNWIDIQPVRFDLEHKKFRGDTYYSGFFSCYLNYITLNIQSWNELYIRIARDGMKKNKNIQWFSCSFRTEMETKSRHTLAKLNLWIRSGKIHNETLK